MAKYLGQVKVDVKDTPYANYTNVDWAMYFIEKYGQIDGDHHRCWVLDQVARILLKTPVIISLATWADGEQEYRVSTGEPSSDYKAWVEAAKADGYDYDVGIAP